MIRLKILEKIRDYYDPNKSDSVTHKFMSKLVSNDTIKLDDLSEKLESLSEEELMKRLAELG